MTTEILIAFYESHDDERGYLNYERCEVLQVVKRCLPKIFIARRYNGESGRIYRDMFNVLDVHLAFKLSELDTYQNDLQYFLSGSFVVACDDDRNNTIIAYNVNGCIKKITLSGQSQEQIERCILEHRESLLYYLDRTSIMYADKRLHNTRVINTTEQRPYIPEWFHGYMSRNKCETILSGNDSGSFLVRRRENDGRFIVSVLVNKEQGNYSHVMLIAFKDGIFFKEKYFPSVLDMVEQNIDKPFATENGSGVGHDHVILKHPVYRAECIVPAEIERFDPSLVDRYIKALESGSEVQSTVRVMVIGHFGVGKSSLTNALMDESVNDISSTNGIDVHECCVAEDGKWTKTSNNTNRRTSMKRIACASQSSEGTGVSRLSVEIEGDDEISPFINKVCPFTALSDNTQPDSKDEQSCSVADDDQIAAVNDTDSNCAISANIRMDNLKEFALVYNEHAHLYENTYPEPDCSIKLWDFGGQLVYYATHQIFHSSKAVYLLVLDLSKELTDVVADDDLPKGNNEARKQDVQSYCKFWMNSIHSFVGTSAGESPVVLVGTHVDKIDGDPEQISENYFENVRKLFSKSPLLKHIQPEEFVVNNLEHDEETLASLRNNIVNVARRQKSWDKRLPAKWIPLENMLIERRNEKLLPFEEICTIGREAEVPIEDREDIRLFLAYHTSTGTFIYFNENGLSEFVVIDPQWIVDAFRCVISARRFRREAEQRHLWEDLVDNAVLRKELLDHVWSEDTFYKHKHVLEAYLQKLGIVARARRYNDTHDIVEDLDYFIVPSLLQRNDTGEIHRFCSNRTSTTVTLVFKFENSFVPPTLFHRTVAAAMGSWSVIEYGDKNMLFANAGVFRLDKKHAGIIRMTDVSIEMRVVCLCKETVDPAQSDRLRRFVEMVLNHELERYHTIQKELYTVCIRCHQGTQCGKTIVTKESLDGQTNVPCPDLDGDHEIEVDRVMVEWFPDAETSVKTLQEVIGNQDDGIQSQQITEQEINNIANALGFNWELLVLSLGVSQATIEQIKMDNKFSCSLQIYHALCEWRKKMGFRATLQSLFVEMSEQRNLVVDWDIIKNRINRFPSS